MQESLYFSIQIHCIMAQTIYTKEIQDMQTGEVVKREIFRKQVANAEQFVRLYIEDIGALAKCSGAEKGVILCSLQYLDYDTNEFILTPERRAAICKCGDIKPDTVSSAISRLLKKNIIVKKSGSTYILNPKLFFYGKDLARASVVEATLVYEIGGGKTKPNPLSKRRGFSDLERATAVMA